MYSPVSEDSWRLFIPGTSEGGFRVTVGMTVEGASAFDSAMNLNGPPPQRHFEAEDDGGPWWI
ncbi:hypothetical protein PILCRDRAFT_4176 [Piloderma croceum F 1598]|uniref:Uncharacterized protein n=1 Tax=Piloderma croceum (strain F 1598) TaxID=765440 RepID=A0A0C3G8E2_PILCF|nr:hypothetical protein PILCRDRAFT_4176 [Piloderma croceum F 1598]